MRALKFGMCLRLHSTPTNHARRVPSWTATIAPKDDRVVLRRGFGVVVDGAHEIVSKAEKPWGQAQKRAADRHDSERVDGASDLPNDVNNDAHFASLGAGESGDTGGFAAGGQPMMSRERKTMATYFMRPNVSAQ